jgi:hypothetical protein
MKNRRRMMFGGQKPLLPPVERLLMGRGQVEEFREEGEGKLKRINQEMKKRREERNEREERTRKLYEFREKKKKGEKERTEQIEEIEQMGQDKQRDQFFKKFKVAEKTEEIEDVAEASARFTAMANGEKLPIESTLQTPSKLSNLTSNFNSEEPQNPWVVPKVINCISFEEKLSKIRYIKSIQPDPFLKQILSTQIYNFSLPNSPPPSAPLPESFSSFASYLSQWFPLFSYEVFWQLTNLRIEGQKWKISQSAWSFKAHFTHVDTNFLHFKMEEPIKSRLEFSAHNHSTFGLSLAQPSSRPLPWINLADALRENDLLLITQDKLSGIYDLFDLSTEEKARRLFNEITPKKGRFLAMVDRRRRISETSVGLKTSKVFQEDVMKILKPSKRIMPIFYAYFLSSLSTIWREYKAMHALEHSWYLEMMLDPARTVSGRHGEMALDYENWKEFIGRNGEYFNQSQVNALEHVAEMKKQEVLLIQGPVS